MGKVIIRYNNGTLESFPCKTYSRAEKVARKRRNVAEFKFYPSYAVIPMAIKKVVKNEPQTLEQLEAMIKGF